MAKSPAAAETTASVEVTYIPRHQEDPVRVTWFKLEFEANNPRVVSNPSLIERARRNPWFRVGNEKQAERGYDPATDKPKTPEQYRAYAITWIKTASASADMEKRWSDEEAMRTDLGVGTDDLEYIARHYDPQLETLRKMEQAGDAR